MYSLSNWFGPLKQTLELLYFASGITIAVAAIWGLKQLRITRDIARINAKREALKFAAERCQYFAERAVPLQLKMFTEYNRLGLTFLSTETQWSIMNGEIVKYYFDTRLLDSEVPKLVELVVYYLNALEAFAIPFVAGVADDDLGYQETAIAFCRVVKMCMPAFFQMRRTGVSRYESIIKLYETWNKRLLADSIVPGINSTEELLTFVDREKVKPIGTDQ